MDFSLLGFGFVALTSVPLTVIDIRQRRLPNKLTVPAIAVTFASLAAAATWQGDWLRFWICAAWGFGGFAVGLLLNIRRMLGMGDVKLLVSLLPLLAWFGWQQPFYGLLAAFAGAGLVLLLKLSMGRLRLDSTLAMGPYLLLGFWLAAGLGWGYSPG